MNNEDNEIRSNLEESPGMEVELVLACEANSGALRMKEGDGNESAREEEERETSNRRWLDTVRDTSKIRDYRGRKCTTELHGRVYRQTS